jgi:hypothetical protein
MKQRRKDGNKRNPQIAQIIRSVLKPAAYLIGRVVLSGWNLRDRRIDLWQSLGQSVE